MIKAYVIGALDEYFDQSEDKEQILEFVKAQLESESPKTRKRAQQFLEKWGEE